MTIYGHSKEAEKKRRQLDEIYQGEEPAPEREYP